MAACNRYHCLMIRWLTAVAVLLLGCMAGQVAVGDEALPSVRVKNVRQAYHDGNHNAFTDMVRFEGRYYLTFRSCPDGHMVHPTSSIVVLASDDAQQWRQVHRFSVDRRDTRDPHFLVFNERLFVYSGTWYSGDATLPREQYDLNLHLGYAVWTEDGEAWSDPILLEGSFGHYIWRAAAHAGTAYLCGRRKRDFAVGPHGSLPVQSMMLASDDGLVWRTAATFQETNGDEVAFGFDGDGHLLGVARRGRGPAELLRSVPPYDRWQRTDLERYIGGPLLARWGGRTVVGGRKQVAGVGSRTTLSWLIDDRLQDFAELPSDGDNSYPGWVELSDTRALVSWYSSHQRDEQTGDVVTAIYLAELEID